MGVRKLRKASPRSASRSSRVHAAIFSGFERGQRNPTVVTLHHLAQAISVSPVDLIKPDAEALREPQKRRTGNKNRKSRRSGVTDLGLCANPAVSGEDGQQEALVVAAYFNADATRSTSRKKKGRVDHRPVESMARTYLKIAASPNYS